MSMHVSQGSLAWKWQLINTSAVYLCDLGSGLTGFDILVPRGSNKVLELTKLLFTENRGTIQNLLDKGEGAKNRTSLAECSYKPSMLNTMFVPQRKPVSVQFCIHHSSFAGIAL